jgi:U8 snoRNA-decapping enzyme
MYKQISFNKNKAYKHSVFIALIFNNSSLFFINRWDGRLGFPGGEVDNDENFEIALLRELQEEINFLPLSSDFKYFSSFQKDNRISHLYTYSLSAEELSFIINNFSKARDFNFEVFGFFNFYFNSNNINHFLKNNFAGSSLQETILLINYLKDL